MGREKKRKVMKVLHYLVCASLQNVYCDQSSSMVDNIVVVVALTCSMLHCVCVWFENCTNELATMSNSWT